MNDIHRLIIGRKVRTACGIRLIALYPQSFEACPVDPKMSNVHYTEGRRAVTCERCRSNLTKSDGGSK